MLSSRLSPIPAHRFVGLGLVMPSFQGERHYRIVDIGRDAVDRPLRPGGRWLESGPELPAFLRQLEGQSQPNVAKPTTRDSSSKRLDSATCAQVCRRQVRRPAPSAYAPVREGTPISGG